MAAVVELREETEGQYVETGDLFFDRVGESVLVKPENGGDEDSTVYEAAALPSRPLAVSERFGLIFVAHSSGFYVVRTGDVMNAAREIKEKGSGSSVMELSLVDVSIGKIRILSLSPDSSILAATVGQNVNFFFVNSLLDKEQEPFSSFSVEGSSSLKDMRWLEKKENSFILLTKEGALYYGNANSRPEFVMDDVDAVDVKSNFIVVARGNIIIILSSKMKEKLRISLSSDSWTNDSDGEFSVKVDSLKWIRPDCIILGCYQLNSDGMEENYFVEVVRSKSGRIDHTEDASQMVVHSYYDVFGGIIDDILPTGDGPYMFSDYLNECQLSIVANRKNTDAHIVLFSWSLCEEQNEPAVVVSCHDKWLPRIELQENGDDNLVVGLCIDKVSMQGKVKVQLGVEDEKELSPYCVLLCLTSEGKLSMFHVAGLLETADPSISVEHLSDEEEDMPTLVSQDHSPFIRSSGFAGPISINGAGNLKDDHNKEVEEDTALKPPAIEVSQPSENAGKQAMQNAEVSVQGETKDFPHIIASKADGLVKLTDVQQFGDTNSLGKITGLQSGSFGQTLTFPFSGGSISSKEGVSQADAQKVGEVYMPAPFSGKFSVDGVSLSKQNGGGIIKELSTRLSPGIFQISPSQAFQSGKVLPSTNFGSRFTFSNNSEGSGSESDAFRTTTADVPGTLVGKPVYLKEATAPSPSVYLSDVSPQFGQRATRDVGPIESLPSIRSSQLSLHETASGLTSGLLNRSQAKQSVPLPGMSKVEPSMSKKFGNIKDVVKELDMLLDSIEGKDGVKDSCIVAQRGSVEALENGINTLSNQCAMWKGIIDERCEEVQQLLDKTIQVVARETFIKGIVKQSSDDRYWDIWNHQKLSTEFELKRRHIMKLNQDLTNQVINLERHFNTLELQKFNDIAGSPRGRRSSQNRFGPSRSVQSLHALHNTINSQLVAAEQLSDCLSRQMEVLSVDSPPVKPKSVKKELFDAIGLPYDNSFSSPVSNKLNDTPSAKKLILSSNSAATKDKSRRNQLSAMKASEPETARRRRDSLGQGLTSFEPPKTTVKRMQLQESRKVGTSKSLLSVDEHHLSSSERSTDARRNRTMPSSLSFQLPTDGMMESSKAKSHNSSMLFSPINESLGSGSTPPAYQRPIPSITSSSRSSLIIGQSKSSSDEKPFAFDFKETKPLYQLPSETTPSDKKHGEVSTFEKVPQSTKSAYEAAGKQGTKITENLNGSALRHEGTLSTLSFGQSVQASPSVSQKAPQFGFGMVKNSSSEVVSSSTGSKSNVDSSKELPVSGSFFSQQPSLSTVPSVKTATSSEPSLGGFGAFGKGAADFNQSPFAKFSSSSSLSAATSSTSSSSLFSTSTSTSSFALSSSSPFSFPALQPSTASSSVTSPMKSIPDSREPEGVEHDPGKASSKPDMTSSPEAVQLPLAETSLKQGLSVEPSLTSEMSSALPIGNETSAGKTSPHVSSTQSFSTQQEPPSATRVLFPTPAPLTESAASSQKVEIPQVTAPEEDEMEEEAPEVNNAAAGLSLGGLNAFGLGSSTPTTAPKGNPFGSFGNVGASAPTASPVSLTIPSGELFRPASFNFQTPQTSQPPQPQSSIPFSGGFGATMPTSQSPPTQGGFGQPAQIGGGQQALGSVLGSFGQSRQIGMGIPGAGITPSSGFGGFGGAGSTGGGFASSPTSGGFAGVASSGGGFGALAAVGGGFAGAASTGGGFGNVGGFAGAASAGGGFGNINSGGGGFGGVASAGGGFGGFAAAAPSGGGFPGAAGGGFGAFGGQQTPGLGGFSSFGGNTGKPAELFTQMRK